MVEPELQVQIEGIRCETVIPSVKYTHYYQMSTAPGVQVERRFSDFEQLIELLNLEFLNEILPAMPDANAYLLQVHDPRDIRLTQRLQDFQIMI